MRLLYCAIDQRVPGTKGGSVHVMAVAQGLAALGHEVHTLASPAEQAFPGGAVRWIPMTPPLGARQLRWLRRRAVERIARSIGADVVMERYYNFAGEGIGSARAIGARAVLEVNAPVVDYPGSSKALLDRALIVQPMRRWRDRVCAASDLIVTPSAAILPRQTPRAKILELEWGADTERFTPGSRPVSPFPRPAPIVAIFAGAFRSWHGAIHLVEAIRQLRQRGRSDIGAVFVGDGPELLRTRRAAADLEGVLFTGSVAHEHMPAYLASADVGVAPFDVSAHRALSLGFYWSPLKIFEYMAAGLPVVAPSVDRIPTLVAHEREGLLYEADRRGALAAALERLADAALRRTLGGAARARAVREYSWKAHCARLAAGIEKL
jgi:glycosyltransferase involved in cell wall biosynthesis